MGASGQAKAHFLGISADYWSLYANLATIGALLVAGIAGLIALRSYLAARDAAADAHIHALFRDYLRMRFDFTKDFMAAHDGEADSYEETRADLEAQLATLKLYAFEEMWWWVVRPRSFFDGWPFWLSPGAVARQQAREAWLAAIVSHLELTPDEILVNLKQCTDSYSLGFLQFLADRWEGAPEMRDIYDHQLELERKGPRRVPFEA